MTFQITPFPLQENAPIRGAVPIVRRIEVPPGTTETREGQTGVISLLQWDALHAGGDHRMTFVLLGEVEYRDMLDNVHSSRFCYFLPDPVSADLSRCPNNNTTN